MGKVHGNAVSVFIERTNLVAEKGLDPPLDGAINLLREIAAKNAQIPTVQCAAKALRAKAGNLPSRGIDDPDLAQFVASAELRRNEVHSFRDFITRSPKIDDIAARTEGGGAFDQCGSETIARKPVGQGRAGDPGTGNQNSVVYGFVPSQPLLF